jgi:predicted nucleic acid-binding protein
MAQGNGREAMTVALDANVIIRLLTRDDEKQWSAANRIFATEQVYVPAGVWLEVEWVMRASYEIDEATFCSAVRALLGLANLETPDRGRLIHALDWHEQGLDFADAFHLAHAGPARRLATFDRDFRARANRLQSTIDVISP